MGQSNNGRAWSRRAVVRTAGATVGAALLAGCSDLTNREYVADAVVLPEAAQAELGFPAVIERTGRNTVEGSAAGQDFSVTVESAVSVYAETDIEFEFERRTTPTGTATPGTGSLDDLDTVSVGALSTPVARVAGDSVNPLATRSLAELLTADAAEPFLTAVGVSEGDGVNWQRGPTRLSTASGTLLGQSVTVETHAGIVSGDTPSATYLHMARIETDSSVVVTAGVQRVDVDDTDRAFVGEDGYLTASELTGVRSTVVEVNGRFVVR